MPDKGFVDMKLPKEKVRKSNVVETSIDQPRYPYGLEVTLGNRALKKLGYGADDFGVGGSVQIAAICNVESVRSSDRTGREPDESVGLQITDLRIIKISNSKITRKAAMKKAKAEY